MKSIIKILSKPNIIITLLLFLIGFLVLIPILHSNFYITHDGEAHVARFAAYFKAFLDGQIPPRWAGNLNYGYGSPLFIFFYPLPGYLASFLHLVSFSYENSYKIIMSMSFVLAPIFLFFWLSRYSKKEIAFAASIIYLLLPYRILDTFVRGDIAEMLSFVFVPLIFLSIDKAQKENSIKAIIFGSIAYGLFILSHNGMAAIFSPVFLVYATVSSKNLREFIRPFLIFIFGLGISSFFWLPAMMEGKFVYEKLVVDTLYKTNFVLPLNLFYSHWGFGPDINLKNGLSPQIGILYISFTLLSIFFLRKVKKYKKEIIFWLVVFFGAAFMTTDYSKSLWGYLPVIRQMGYPWRFTALSGFASCMVIFYFLNHIKNKTFIVLILILFFVFSVPFIKVQGYVNRSDNFYNSYQGTTDYHLRTSSIWTAGDFWKKAKRQFEIIAGEGEIINEKKKSNLHTLTVSAKTNISILDNTVYFPGWIVTVDKQKTLIQFQDMNHRGLITFNVPRGNHIVEIRFEEPRLMLLADYISLSSIIFLFVLYIFRKKAGKILI
ncbi:MAG: 6-pyruvoyl-tetrahydropterin synthase-related protein [Candidatus Levybacteria bacterium]|nr:6-pyruvoyl-tetrahydropterin synthase-related protein [Candidatus Levybacteria bacterium]